jgi:hypothetical protein
MSIRRIDDRICWKNKEARPLRCKKKDFTNILQRSGLAAKQSCSKAVFQQSVLFSFFFFKITLATLNFFLTFATSFDQPLAKTVNVAQI